MGGGGWGGVADSAPLLVFEDIKAITTKLGGQIVRPKKVFFELVKLVTSYDVTITSGSQSAVILDPRTWI